MGTMKSSENALARWLRERGKQQKDVWHALLVDPASLSRWVNGKGRPGLAQAIALERFTEGAVPVSSWLTESERKALPEPLEAR